MKSLKECALTIFKSHKFITKVNEDIVAKVLAGKELTDFDNDNLSKMLLAYEDVLESVDFFEASTDIVFQSGVNDARLILYAGIRQDVLGVLEAFKDTAGYTLEAHDFYVKLDKLETEYNTSNLQEVFYSKIGVLSVGKKLSDSEMFLLTKNVTAFMELVEDNKLKLKPSDLKNQIMNSDGRSAISLSKTMSTKTGDYLHSFGYLYIYMLRMVDTGSKLYSGLPVEDKQDVFLDLATKHLTVVNFTLKNLLVLFKELTSYQRILSRSMAYLILENQINGFSEVVESYVRTLSSVPTIDKVALEKYNEELKILKRNYSDLEKYKKGKSVSPDVTFRTFSDVLDCAGELIIYRNDDWHFDVDSIPVLAELGLSLKRSMSVYGHSKNRDEFTFVVYLTLMFIYDSYSQNLGALFLKGTAFGTWDVPSTDDRWHHDKLDNFARLRGVSVSDFEMLSSDMGELYRNLIIQLNDLDLLTGSVV